MGHHQPAVFSNCRNLSSKEGLWEVANPNKSGDLVSCPSLVLHREHVRVVPTDGLLHHFHFAGLASVALWTRRHTLFCCPAWLTGLSDQRLSPAFA